MRNCENKDGILMSKKIRNYSHNMNIIDTEIYECTYGLIRLFHTGNADLNNCTISDYSNMELE